MKLQILTSILLVGLCCPVYGQQWRSSCQQENNGGEYDDNDDEKYMYKPCGDSNDLHCIKNFFMSREHCLSRGVHNNDDEYIHMDKHAVRFPTLNLSITHTVAKISGLGNGKVEKFYINKRTNNLVMAVNFDAIVLEAEKSYLEFHRPGKEPVVTSDSFHATYAALLTAVIPMHSGIAYKDATVTAYVPSGKLDFYLGPKVYESNDPTVARTLENLNAEGLPVAVQETFLTKAPIFFFAYLQKYICDLNISLNSL